MAPGNLIGALEMLATKRREFTSAIVTLASALGVDANPYLVDVALEAHVTGAPFVPVIDPPAPKKEPAPPRPQSPASPSTNGTGRARKVEGELPAEILLALQKHGAPMQPKDLAKAMKKSWSTLAYHIKKLEKAKQVVMSGTTFDRRVSLA